jgi:hypothetical protein
MKTVAVAAVGQATAIGVDHQFFQFLGDWR